MSWMKQSGTTARRMAQWLGEWLGVGERSNDRPVHAADPLGGALDDATLLIAFAAQSRRNVKAEKVAALVNASTAVAAARKAGLEPSAKELTDFWSSYDAFAVDMAPLSAHSIRASIRLNGLRFPASLFTPTAYNAALAVVVFLLCLGLQGFWVGGDELIRRAAQLDQQKTELLQRQERNEAALRRVNARQEDKSQRICEIAECDGPDLTLGSPPPRKARRDADQAQLTTLVAEFGAVRSEVVEKEFAVQELAGEQTRLNEQARPLEQLLGEWYRRAQAVCSRPYLEFLCPVNRTNAQASPVEALQKELAAARKTLADMRGGTSTPQGVVTADGARSAEGRFFYSSANASPTVSQMREINRLQSELRLRQGDSSRSIVMEVRIIAANLSAYLIAMVMGVLGALTFILRTMSVQLRDHTYVPVSASISIVRICLGAIAGVFGSLLVPGSDVGMKSLPPLFVPFIFGYGIEILFSLLDKVVRSFTQPDQTGTPPGRAA